MTNDRWGVVRRGALVLFVALLAQVVVSDMRVFGSLADLMLLVPLAAGSLAGPDRGATYGFVAGLLYDLVLLPDTPFGLSALVYALVGYAVGTAAGLVLEPRWWFHVGLAIVGSVVAMAMTVLLDQVLGSRYPVVDVAQAAAVVALWNALLILPVRRLMGWALGAHRADRYDLALP